MKFEYKQVRLFEELIDINDIGQCALELTDSNGCCYYIIIRTIMGETMIVEYGPIVSDINILPKVVDCSFSRIEYNMEKIKKKINLFLIGRKNVEVECVRELEMKEALDLCVDIVDYMKKHI